MATKRKHPIRNNFLVDRIVRTNMVPAKSLLAHPDNFRIHHRLQQELVNDSLINIGWVRHILANIHTNLVVDGHLRLALALQKDEEALVPVDFVDLTELEEKTILAMLDESAMFIFVDEQKRQDVLAVLEGSNLDTEMIDRLKSVIANRAQTFVPLISGVDRVDPTASVSKQAAYQEQPRQIPTMLMLSDKEKGFFYDVLNRVKDAYEIPTLGDALLHVMRLWYAKE